MWMCINCRVALEATAASPVAAHLAARRLTTTSPLPQKVDDSNQVVSASAASETSLAAKHVTCMVSIVGSSAQACWLAVCEDETVQSGHLQALLNTFASDALFCHDKPPGLRQVHHKMACVSAATIYLSMLVNGVLQLFSGVCHVVSRSHAGCSREVAV